MAIKDLDFETDNVGNSAPANNKDLGEYISLRAANLRRRMSPANNG